jgi:hypothetical protein
MAEEEKDCSGAKATMKGRINTYGSQSMVL